MIPPTVIDFSVISASICLVASHLTQLTAGGAEVLEGHIYPTDVRLQRNIFTSTSKDELGRDK